MERKKKEELVACSLVAHTSEKEGVCKFLKRTWMM
jgi:hypothetical protein